MCARTNTVFSSIIPNCVCVCTYVDIYVCMHKYSSIHFYNNIAHGQLVIVIVIGVQGAIQLWLFSMIMLLSGYHAPVVT